MEIISYYGQKRPMGTETTALSIEDMLRSQRSQTSHRAQSSIARHRKEAEFENFLLLINSFCAFLIKARILVPIICLALCLFAASTWAVQYIQTFANPIMFQTIPSSDTRILSGQMRNFALATEPLTADEEGNIAFIDEADIAGLFNMPVSFSPYTVQSGDSISSISNRFGLRNISTLIGINNVENVRFLRAGQKLEIPSIDGLLYTIKTGDNLDRIAQRYSLSIEQILDVNELASSILLPGDEIFLPGVRLDSTSLKEAMGELFRAPLSINWRISSPYGYRADPFTGNRSFHTGMDLVVPRGTSVKAAMAGTVSTAGYSNVYGNYVIMNHGNGYQTMYAHFMSPAPVKSGQSVSQGGVIGYVGSTGYSTGDHLHFTVYKNAKLIDPREVLKF